MYNRRESPLNNKDDIFCHLFFVIFDIIVESFFIMSNFKNIKTI